MNSVIDPDKLRSQWHPIASLDDLPYRHVFHAQLLGRELAVWRADDDHLNVWENRCLHRGVRLSIGINDGTELMCQYHGWRYANRTAGCTYIPAHPADAPARSICNNTYPAVARYGLLWSSESAQQEFPEIAELETHVNATLLPLRALPINAPVHVIAELLQRRCELLRLMGLQVPDLRCYNETTLFCKNDAGCELMYFIQPVDSQRSVLRGVLPAANREGDGLAMLRAFNVAHNHIRDLAEAHAATLTPLPAMVVPIKPVDKHLSDMPALTDKGVAANIRVSVQSIETLAQGIKYITLQSVEHALPTFHPGAHIDVHLPNGLVRQYSLTNGPGQTDCYRIAVKHEAQSRGASAHIHEHLKTGDLLAISEPRNNFPLRRDALNTRLIAGGIGITPLISMAQAMSHTGQPFELHYFVQADSHVAFSDILSDYGEQVTVYVGLDASKTQDQLVSVLGNYKSATHCYVCGPAPMLDATRLIARQQHWPDEAVHFEYFSNTTSRDNEGAFEVSLARSGLTLQVPAGKTLLSVLREHGIPVPSSCEKGACGTCRITVLDGVPRHQDVYLNEVERQRADCMMSCVSRAKSSSLTLDI
ncbi:MAG: Rieske 2Fe-2S domain-containing protein [Granulosicoccus sp.]